MQLFYNAGVSLQSKHIFFDKTESRYIVSVLRKKEGETLHVTNGKGLLFFAKINNASIKKCIATIIKIEEKQRSWNYYLHLAIAPTKNKDRFEWFLEKATEIGVDEITPIICQNSERRIVKTERFEKIIQSAMKQSLQYRLPKLNDSINFLSFMHQDFDGELYIAHCQQQNKYLLTESVQKNSKVTILIGPEGDFSSEEIKSSIAKNFVPITLSKNRLRTETAGIVAVQNISFINRNYGLLH